MPSQISNYKCPACGGPLRFAGDTGKLQCDYCGSAYDVAEIERLMAETDAKAANAFQKEHSAPSAESGQRGAGGDTSDTGGAGGQNRGGADVGSGGGWDTSDLGSDWGADAAVRGSFAYQRSGYAGSFPYLDDGFISLAATADSLVLLYRPHDGSSWRILAATLTGNGNEGTLNQLIRLANLKKTPSQSPNSKLPNPQPLITYYYSGRRVASAKELARLEKYLRRLDDMYLI